jgi:hypothetical protein
MTKPVGWDEMSDADKWVHKRVHLEHVYGAAHLYIVEDHDAEQMRDNITGTVAVYSKDYYADFEVADYPNAEDLSNASSWCLRYTSFYSKEEREEILDMKGLSIYETYMQERQDRYDKAYQSAMEIHRLEEREQRRNDYVRRQLFEMEHRRYLVNQQLPYYFRYRT